MKILIKLKQYFCKHKVIQFENITHFDLDIFCSHCNKKLTA